ncbi:hypothetical protein [Pyrofollis japonicus]|uniref:hypothetical protein n=1 Tax=Pyrofollis japonicus TaxID=3060460 RepID=UPI00295A6916|nr:hypothetical protein [Pyrofollis japonicus]
MAGAGGNRYAVISFLKSCVKSKKVKVPSSVCSEVEKIHNTVYSSKACVALEIQAIYTVNLLANELIVQGKPPTPAHLEALIGTIMGWGRIQRFKGVELKAVSKLLTMNVNVKDYKTLRDLALDSTIVDIAATLSHSELEEIVSRALNTIGANGGTTWGYKALHLLMPSIFPALDNNIAMQVFDKEQKTATNFAKYTICLGILAKHLIAECSMPFSRVPGLGYAYTLSKDMPFPQTSRTDDKPASCCSFALYLPITRCLDFTVWSMSSYTRKDGAQTIYDHVTASCIAKT